jgi:hypothetical protein
VYSLLEHTGAIHLGGDPPRARASVWPMLALLLPQRLFVHALGPAAPAAGDQPHALADSDPVGPTPALSPPAAARPAPPALPATPATPAPPVPPTTPATPVRARMRRG